MKISTSIVLIPFLLSLIACSDAPQNTDDGTASNSGRISPIYNGPAEISYCSSAISYSGSTVTITGNATFLAREIFTTSGGGLGAAGAAKPIRHAEVRITNSGGTVVQCAETDTNGDFSFVLPEGSSTFTVSVNARAQNDYADFSVLNRPEKNTVYTLTKDITASANQAITMQAPATGTVLGGAFNIFDQIVKVNDYLRLKLSSCPHTGCQAFGATDSAPNVKVYWELGYNPGDYYKTGGVSFYLPGYSRLFILGGVSGDYNNSDTDHFDNSIIIHEYGHFLEDAFSLTDSPGGSHSGNKMIDARLAWSEGFANFINAAVKAEPTFGGTTSDATYIDTTGNIDGSTSIIFNINIESYSGCVAGCDNSSEAGEGNFREFAITRFLYDAVDDTSSESENSNTDNVKDKFDEIWAAMTTTGGFKRTGIGFRDIGLLNYSVHTALGDTTWGNILDMHGMVNDSGNSGSNFRKEYAQLVETGGGCNLTTNQFQMNPKSDSGNEHPDSNLLRNNDFFMYSHSGGSATIVLNYKTMSGAVNADLDLFVYDSTTSFTETPTGFSESNPNATVGNIETETVTLSGLAAGDYLINVYDYFGKGFGAVVDFELLIDGGNLCPVNIP